MAFVDPKALYDAEQDLDIYNSVELEPREDSGDEVLLYPGTFKAVICYGKEQDEVDKNKKPTGLVEWRLKLGLTLPGMDGAPPIKGVWWITVKESQSARWGQFMRALIPADAPAKEWRPMDLAGRPFKVEVDYGREQDESGQWHTKTEGRLWPQKFFPMEPSKQPRSLEDAPARGRGQPQRGGQQQRSGGYGQRQPQRTAQSSAPNRDGRPPQNRGYTTYGSRGQQQPQPQEPDDLGAPEPGSFDDYESDLPF